LQDTAYVVDQAGDLSQLASITNTSSFDINDLLNGKGRIQADGSGNLTLAGNIYIDGGNFHVKDGATATTILYSGNGTIYSTGNILIDSDFETTGGNSFPGNSIGFMTPNTISFNKAGTDVMGIFYAESSILFSQDVNLVGSLASNYIDLGANSPDIYQAPDIMRNLPSEMIGDTTTCFVKILSWQKQ